jgi:hypothetical protein
VGTWEIGSRLTAIAEVGSKRAKRRCSFQGRVPGRIKSTIEKRGKDLEFGHLGEGLKDGRDGTQAVVQMESELVVETVRQAPAIRYSLHFWIPFQIQQAIVG